MFFNGVEVVFGGRFLEVEEEFNESVFLDVEVVVFDVDFEFWGSIVDVEV